MSDKEISKELNTISALNGWGFLGIFIPIIGIICYGISYSRANKLLLFMTDEQKDKYRKTVHSRKMFSTFMTIICLLIVGYWLLVWAANTNRSTTPVYTPATETVTHPIGPTNAEMRSSCLDSVNEWYSTNREGVTTVYQEQNLLMDKQQRIDECSLRYQ